MKDVKTIALYGNSRQDKCIEGIRNYMAEAREAGFGLLCHHTFAAYLLKHGISEEELPPSFEGIPDADIAVSFGGDGTFLKTVRCIGNSRIPVAGVNTGHLGYLAHFSLSEPRQLLESLREGTTRTEWRKMLHVRGEHIPENFICRALNEISVLKDDSASMIETSVEIDGYHLADYLADGVIVSTATGSTAYNLSAGGPILQPNLDCMVLSPIAPHMLTLRPIVLSGNSTLRLTTKSRGKNYRLSVDGVSLSLPSGSSIDIEASPDPAGVLMRAEDTFASTLREKLLWGVS